MIMKLEQVKAMSDDQLRIKVAVLCGYVYEGNGNWKAPDGTPLQALYGTGGADGVIVGLGNYDEDIPPDYSTDLNAMHEAEKLASYDEYWPTLFEIVTCEEVPICENQGMFIDAMSTVGGAPARQRAEAFVLTMEDE